MYNFLRLPDRFEPANNCRGKVFGLPSSPFWAIFSNYVPFLIGNFESSPTAIGGG